MNMQLSKSPIGLDGIPAAETVLSHVDGERGELIIAGERVADLVRKTGFEGVTARLWSGGTGAADQRGRRCAPRWARPASAPSPGCRTCWESPGACRSSTVSAPPSPDCAPSTDCRMKPPSSARFR